MGVNGLGRMDIKEVTFCLYSSPAISLTQIMEFQIYSLKSVLF